ncbi:hypothetical protein CO058_00165 [candidate division WWE3 bacterium CG_4_9_14_0_2_um_filter_35_11]|uniref:Sortase n=1 Tax=candidate division WWE3 bacterium CG_4_9_14_0_2_um_filter_35_11 TaxID=1975077 RepID=A0A2M8EMR5_UNCKA|nr:MAG: hypothetical protein COV25_00125 [candidate division WWE3 bacterium CG10_big_fil_rev_8_21_14_0_10_35_32]PJC24033.1 MAG: hypothetical protein CO058_00165 [candidate division WWE3 bacterium CG_4_9_14_0_2_um_filter_35_11]
MILRFFTKVLGDLFFIIGLGIALFTYAPIIYSEVVYQLKVGGLIYSEPKKEILSSEQLNSQSNLQENSFDYENIESTTPVSQDFDVIIDKISVNAPVVANVDITNEKSYMEALRSGVAHAGGTALPGQNGNMFIFAHSSLNFWQLGPYATVFNLLSKLEIGDTVVIYYEGKGYVYSIFETSIVHGWNTKPFDQEYAEPVVTLVTCDPPGTTQNRRVVKGRLVL